MHMDDRAVLRQAVEQFAKRPFGRTIPDALQGRLDRGRIAQKVGLAEAYDLDARRGQVRRDGSSSCENNGMVARGLQAFGAVEGDLRLPARDVGVIDADDDGKGLGSFDIRLH